MRPELASEVASSCRWDWYEGTLFGVDAEVVVPAIARTYGWRSVGPTEIDVAPARALHGYLRGVGISKGEETLCKITWGGNPGVHLQATGSASPQLWKVVNALRLEHACEWSPSRVDASVDWIERGLFDELATATMAFAAGRGLTIDQQGDWHRGMARTLYVGSRTSVVRLVIYEKGYQLDADPNWVRMEVRVRPKGHARSEVGAWAPIDALGASKWLVDLQLELGLGARMQHAVGTVWRPSDSDRARNALVRQYARVMLGWFDECGSWEQLGVELGTRVLRAVEHSTLQDLLQPSDGNTPTDAETEVETVVRAGASGE